MLSRKAKYGLKALLRIAATPEHRPVMIADLAAREHIPKKFLEQILLELKHRSVVESRRGPGGGYALRRPAHQLSVLEVIRALDGSLAPVPCVSVLAPTRCDDCGDETTCAVRIVMNDVHEATIKILASTTLADLVRATAEAEQRRAAGDPPTPAPLNITGRAVPFRRVPRKATASDR